MKDLKQRAVRGVAWSAVQNWGSRFISFLVFPLLARLLSPDAFGLVALAGVYIAFIEVFAEQSFGTAIEQRAVIEPAHLDSTFWFFLSSALILTGMTIALADLIGAFFKSDDLAPVLRWLAWSYVFTCLSGVQTSILRRDLKMRALATRSLAATAAGGAVGIGMALAGCGVWSLVGQQLTNGAVGTVILWRTSSWRPGLRFSWAHFREVGAVGMPVMGTRVLDFLNRRFDSLLIGRHLGSVALGYYNIAYRLLRLLTDVLTGTTSQVAVPAFAKVQNETARLRGAFYKAVQFTSLVAFPVFFAIFVLTPEIVSVVFGDKWQPSMPVLRVLSLVGLLHSIQYFNGSVMLALGRARTRLWLLSVHTIINVVGFLIVVRYGIFAVAATYVGRAYLLAPLDLFLLKKMIAVEYRGFFRQLWPAIAGSGAMIVVMLVVRGILGPDRSPLVTLLVGGALGGLAYAVTLFILCRPVLREVVQTAKLLRRS